MLNSCIFPKYLPSADKIDVNEYGSYIKIARKKAPSINGELIAIDSSKIFVLSEDSVKCMIVPLIDIKWFSLRYATSKNYGWSIPLFSIASFAGGMYFIFLWPLNLIVTSSVTTGANKSFKYNNSNITYDKLKMFARFPEGIPPNVDLTTVK